MNTATNDNTAITLDAVPTIDSVMADGEAVERFWKHSNMSIAAGKGIVTR
jgi:hypothetical protein